MADASLIKIKRSGVAGNPRTLHSGELAYSWFEGDGGNRLYIGTGVETDGNASNHVVIGGKFFTDLLTVEAGTLTHGKAIVVDSDGKIDKINTSAINGGESLTLTSEKTVVTNLYTDADTTLETFIKGLVDTEGLHIDAGDGIVVAEDSNSGVRTISLAKVDGIEAPTSVGSTTAIPIITVDTFGRVTAVDTAEISTTLLVSDGQNSGTLSLATDTLSVKGSDGATVKYNLADKAFEVKADETVVRTSEDQEIAGEKTFETTPLSTADQTRKTAEDNELVKIATLNDEVVYENAELTTVKVGGLDVGSSFKEGTTVKDILQAIFYPYIAPTAVKINSTTQSATLYETGTTQTVSSASVGWTEGSIAITKVEILNNGSVVGTAVPSTKKATSTANSISVSLDTPIEVSATSADKKFTARVTDSEGTVNASNSVSFSYCYPYFYGKVASTVETLSSDIIKGLTKLVQTKGNKSLSFSGSYEKMVFAYPASYGSLKSDKGILDPNNLDNTGLFERVDVTVTCTDGSDVEYYAYILKSPADFSGTYTFSY